ncbi:MAG: glycerol kinase GlpK [Sphingomonadales bacterium]
MTDRRHILAIDQGTTSTRSIVFDDSGAIAASAQAEIAQHYPQDGWVEHDPEEIWRTAVATAREALARAGLAAESVAAIGITNQRETTLLWDRATGKPLHNAIVWQDRRTAAACAALKAGGHEERVRSTTGLLLDPYFSATKLAWLLDAVPGARRRAQAGELAFGTVDSFLLWRLTGGRVHATDATNASRTLLFDIGRQRWCPEMLALFDIPAALLPEVRDSAAEFGTSDPEWLGAPVPVGGIAGDQQAALVGQGCFARGQAKATYGTGCFMLLNTGAAVPRSESGLVATTGYRLGGDVAYAVEGSIFAAGATLQWLRDGLGLIADVAATQAMAASVPDNGGVYLVPAFVGLGAPHWQPDARGLIAGLNFGATGAHVARAALEAVAYQTHDLIEAMAEAAGERPSSLRIDGGMTANGWLCQFLADILAMPVERPVTVETTALGAAMLAGIGVGLWDGPRGIAQLLGRSDRFAPRLSEAERQAHLAGWREALGRVLGSYSGRPT